MFEVLADLKNFEHQTSNYLPNSYFQFKEFIIHQDRCAMKVTTDACLFGAWIVKEVERGKLKVESVLDIGTGTGLLALMFAQKNPKTTIEAIEIDKDTAKQAMENADASPWKERITIIDDDVNTFPFSKKYNLIITNPPFYEREIRSATSNKNIAHHSEELKLEQLLNIIKDNLNSDGTFFMLLPYKRNKEVRELFKDHQLHIAKLLFVRQSIKHDYFRIMLKGKLADDVVETEFDEMSIWDDKQQYTNEFVALLKDYYLYL